MRQLKVIDLGSYELNEFGVLIQIPACASVKSKAVQNDPLVSPTSVQHVRRASPKKGKHHVSFAKPVDTVVEGLMTKEEEQIERKLRVLDRKLGRLKQKQAAHHETLFKP